MSEVKWTKNQELAIKTPPSVLVNAAAGSGKTAVLVERIIRKLISGETSIERLLIVTFARDAASGMFERLKKAITKSIIASTDEVFTARMRKELRGLNYSDITTIDGFCINVVRKNFHLLGIDSGFKIIDADEGKIMLFTAIDEFLDQMYEAGDVRAELLSSCYSKGFSDFALKNIIKDIYEFTRSLKEPKEWLKTSALMYKDFKNSLWYEILSKEGNFEKYGFSDGQLDMYTEGIYPVISVLCDVISEFSDYFFNKKQEKNNFEFNDLEHMCYELLRDFSDVREEYQRKYDEILMDEYQDTNALQDGIFSLISDKKFMVGDMKQSIYRFRNSDPLIFKACDRLFTDKPDEGTKILLSENFRSRPQVLKSVNEIFSRIMSEDAGEIDYDDSQSLRWGNKSYDEPYERAYFSELCILEGKDKTADEDDNNVKLEARFIAKKIRKMIDDGFLIKDGDEKRRVRAGDFVIIQNSVRASANIYIEELKKAGIDGYSENEGYFDRSEIKLMLALIDVVNNPLSDISLVAVLRSVIFGFSDDDLAQIRMTKKGSFYDAVCEASKKDTDYGKKCKGFLESLLKWREYAKYMTSDRLIWTIYEETHFYDLMGVMYGGEEAQANLRLLFEKAKQYEKTGFRGLFHFLEYIKKMEEGSKVQSATVVMDNNNAVRIMTIHKSKGLEFPVCIFSGAGKRFQAKASGNLLLHKDLGIGINFVDYKKGYFSHTAVQEIIKEAQKREEQAETLRKLYVGLTRAKEKLIVVATVQGKKLDKDGNLSGGAVNEREKWNTYYSPENGEMESLTVNSINRYIDFIAPIVLAHKEECGWTSEIVGYTPDAEEVTDDRKESYNDAEIPTELIESLLGTAYKQDCPRELPSKISVTGIKLLRERFETDDDVLDFEIENKYTEGLNKRKTTLSRPKFLQDKGLTGAERGTAYHTLLSVMDGKASVYDKIEELKQNGIFSQTEAESIDASDIEKFFKSELGKRLLASKTVFREEAFEIMADAEKITKKDEHKGAKILLQGVIDCMFEEDGELVLLDYKTDKGLSEAEFLEHYAEQLKWYKEAAEKLTKMKVKETYLYSFDSHKTIEVL